MAKENLTKVENIDVSVREVDFVTRFGRNWKALQDILGIMRPIKKAPGTKLVAYTASCTLESGDVGEGEEIPYSLTEVKETYFEDVKIEKFSKAVSIESVNKYGAENAINRTDDAFLTELQNKVLNRFYAFLQSGTLTGAEATFQMAVAMAIGKVVNKFESMDRDITDVAVWVNTIDAYKYLGAAEVSVQTQFGLTYIENFLGAKIVFLSSKIPQNKVLATPVENIILYYIDPNDSDFAKLGLQYRVAGETNLIGFHANGNYNTAVGESFALMGMKLWAEYLDGIAVIDVDDNTLTDLTVTADSSAATYPWTDKTPADFQSDVAVANGEITGTLKFIEGGLASSGPLAGDGHFLALKFDNYASGLTYANVQVGLVPSASGMELQTLDSDKDAVFKITDKANQKVKVVQSDNAGHKNVQFFGLSGLTLEESTGA